MNIQYKTPGVCVFESALFRTTTTVVQTADLILLVDPNWLPREIEHVRDYVERIRAGRPVYLLFTHSDYDHIIGYGAFPGATVIACRSFSQNADREAVLEQIRQFDDEYYIARPYPVAYPEVDIPIDTDGQVITIGKTLLRFYLAPGHTRDSLFTLVEPLQVWLAGDYLCNVEFPFVCHSFSDYRESLEKASRIIRGWEPQLLVPGHGDVTNLRQEMRRRREEAQHYLQQLETSVRTGDPFPEDELLARYPYPRILRRYHRDNLELLRREMFTSVP